MFAIEPSTEIAYRQDFALLANARGYIDAVEVGTDQAVFAADFLSRFKGNWLLCVDPYRPCDEFEYDRTGDMIVAAQALSEFHGRFRFIRQRSPDAVAAVKVFISPEFVYVDGQHDEASVAADLAAWWAILPEHGMIAGHDWDDAHPGVRSAVEAFARERDVVVRLTRETTSPPSWYIYRTEPETLFHRFFREGEGENPRYVPA